MAASLDASYPGWLVDNQRSSIAGNQFIFETGWEMATSGEAEFAENNEDEEEDELPQAATEDEASQAAIALSTKFLASGLYPLAGKNSGMALAAATDRTLYPC